MANAAQRRARLQPGERHAVAVLASVFAVRMLGLFLLLPVLALHADGLPGAGATLIGVALGAYGLSQALLQVPFGLASDRLGRKPVVLAGLALFALGSVTGALSETIHGIIFARILQGAGAISAVVTAFLADLVRAEARTRAMAFIGAGIGTTFLGSLVLGPWLDGLIGVAGIFWLTAVLAAGAAVLILLLPGGWRPGTDRSRPDFAAALADRALLRLDFGIFSLHFMLTAVFVAVPFLLRDGLGVPTDAHWRLYMGVMIASLAGTLPLILAAERGYPAGALRGAIGLIVVAMLLLMAAGSYATLAVALGVFFAAFNFLEARLPAEVSTHAPGATRGAALGVYASAQFLGAFAGGATGGWLMGRVGQNGAFAAGLALGLAWLLVSMRAQLGKFAGNAG